MKVGKTKDFYVISKIRHNGVTGSCIFNSAYWPDGRNISFLVEAGAAQGKDNKDYFNSFFPFNAEKISFIILTHDHTDHQGLLPVVVRQGFKGHIYTHYATANLLNVSLFDSCKIYDSFSNEPLATRNEDKKTLDLVLGCATKKIIKPDKNIRIVFYSNGHLVGAVVVLVVITCPGEDDITLIFSGDYKDHNVFFNVEIPPKQVRELNISALFCESTYGDVDSTDSMFKKCLAENTSRALKEGKTVIYPAFSKGRYQEVLFDIKMWKKHNIIPEDTLVYADGRNAQKITSMFRFNDLGIKKIMKNFVPKETKFVPMTRDRMKYRRKIMENNTPKIIIAPGGMVSYGPIQNYVDYYLSRNDALIHLLGYCSPDSKGYELLNTPIGEKISYNGHEQVKLCEVLKTSEKTSHAQRDVLLRFIKYFLNVNSIIINHGEEEVQKKFREFLLEHLNLPEDKILTASSDIAYRIESNGVTDLIPTKMDSLF